MRALLYPRFRLNLLPAMVSYALLGAVIAGVYGVIHDQITYSISPEYFTRLKFLQFHYAHFGGSQRIFVAEIGFLATWWVGFIAGWFLARVALPNSCKAAARSLILRGFLITASCAFLGSLLGFGWGLFRGPNADYTAWQGFVTNRGVVDLPRFVRVAYIHNAGYLAGLLGLIVALIYVRRAARPRSRHPA